MLVTCPQCGAKVSANQHVVRRAAFTQAHERVWTAHPANAGQRFVNVGGRKVRLLAQLARRVERCVSRKAGWAVRGALHGENRAPQHECQVP